MCGNKLTVSWYECNLQILYDSKTHAEILHRCPKQRGKGRFVTTPFKLFASAQTPSRLKLRVPQLIMQPTCIHHIAFIYMDVGITIARDGTAAAEYPPDTAMMPLLLSDQDTAQMLDTQSFDSLECAPCLYLLYCHGTRVPFDVSHPTAVPPP
ncbi:hypothetical protein TRIATDRAFT_87037 [Trichoderma atroviride IMI 206040]|uniref:Uncharacterized protein n=1 Tax=Hypocrea atroviridis (strain ATCC 20476 / IMI 206040) TaxID=452589 RepID=G9NZQ4_HYPAI|nr:uncharacterized protein TRIATDRAFT_87037 [Trichoderma atroviride IMI 206040]EHK43953.1 hypothetical protein TRIATDRAFT_87037 [Trichoderma atroviride IMI 206040]